MTKLCGVYSVSQQQLTDDDADDDGVNPATTHFPSTEFLSFVYVLSTGGTPKNIRNY